jgi:uncharacterized membrane protein
MAHPGVRRKRQKVLTMADLIMMAFSTEPKAEAVRQTLLDMHKDYLIEPDDAVIATKYAEGQVKLNQVLQPVRAGAVSGMFWGSLIGLLFVMPLAGAAIATAPGAFRGRLAELGIDDNFTREAGKALQSGNAVLFLMIHKMTTDKVLVTLRGAGGKASRSSLNEGKEGVLQSALACLQAAIVTSGSPLW